ncbi:MFS transporter [Verrucosispora sp. WMMA2044]|uniref:MFS transporter n=1 Tax=Verrucosispora sp. WMMA2044 TaxID=3016419 RepID=UPI00248CD040|nr:MFS transporter [Verrucosispora sp. WMMA2044]WBB50214.1 MFS transporter [Verrucosispora sp. WMMA2044]
MRDRSRLGRPFWTFWSAAALANLGDGIRVAAFPLLAAALTDDPLAVGAVAAAQFLPWLVSGLLAGALADRRGARTLLAAADTGRVVVLAALATTVALGWATIAHVVAAAFLLGVGETIRDTADAPPAADGDGVLAGLRWLLRQPMMRTLVLVTAAVAAADTAWFAIFVLYARDALDLGALGFGLLLATGAAGGLVGSFAADRILAGFHHRSVLTWSMAVTAGVPVLLAVVGHRAVAVVVVVTTSAAFAVLNVAALSVRQRLVPGGLLGRVIAASRLVTYSCTALGALAGGALAARAGIEAPFLFSGVVAVAATVAWWLASRPTTPGAGLGLR